MLAGSFRKMRFSHMLGRTSFADLLKTIRQTTAS
jgi:hypothetical protein